LPEATLVQAGARIRDVIERGADRLAAAGCASPRLDAELLLGCALQCDRARLVLDAGAPVDGAALVRFEALLKRRAAREPVAYILGRKDFRRISLAVDRRVLVPRPETESLVEVGLTLGRGARVVDLGTGSGAVALALKDERPDLSVWATDVSADALAVASENARRLGLEVRFVEADLLDRVEVTFDAVLANLPYVSCGFSLPPEVELYEPPGALFGGPDGLELVRRLVAMVGAASMLALEVGFDQAPAVDALLRSAGWRSVQRLHDLAGHERVVVGRS
jgi:release factor glutamine methyltransferase